MKIILTGATGLIGSRFFDLLKGRYEIVPLSSSFGVDITDRIKVRKFLDEKNPALIVHMAAKTNVDECEDDKTSDRKMLESQKVLAGRFLNIENLDVNLWKNNVSAFGVNVIGTKNIADWAHEKGIKVIYLSTDFVFDGNSDEPYSEESKTEPIDWYGQTKLWGERVINGEKLIGRISFPYGYRSPLKRDLVWTIFELLKNNETVELINDQIITPTFIDDVVGALDFLTNKNESGVFNIVGNNFLSPYEIGIAIAREYLIPESKILSKTRADIYRGRAPRPFKTKLYNAKLCNLGFEMTDFFEVLKIIKQ